MLLLTFLFPIFKHSKSMQVLNVIKCHCLENCFDSETVVSAHLFIIKYNLLNNDIHGIF